MKTLLLIMSVLILLSKKSSFVDFFKDKYKVQEESIEKFNESLNSGTVNKDLLKGIAIVLAAILCFFYGLYYFLASIYVGYFVFTIISILQMVDTVGAFKRVVKLMNGERYKPTSIKLNLIIDLLYIGFVIFSIYTRW